MFEQINFVEIFSTFLVMFAIIDITGSIPIFVSMREKGAKIKPLEATLTALLLFVGFIYRKEHLAPMLAKLPVVGRYFK